MSEENVDRLLEAVEAFNRGDWPRYVACHDPEIRFEPQQAALQGGYMGHEGIRQWRADMVEHYTAPWRVDLPDVRDLGDRVLAFGTLTFTGRSSGVAIEVPVALVATFRNGLMIHFKDYGDKHHAREAAGLSE